MTDRELVGDSGFTPDEMAVLEYYAATGDANAAIAKSLNMGQRTVERHFARMCKARGYSRRDQLLAYYLKLKYSTGADDPDSPVAEAARQSIADGLIRVNLPLFCRFQPLPSRGWKDPAIEEVVGFRHPTRPSTSELPRPLRAQLPDGKVIDVEAWVPLCIPSYAVEVEWRERAHVHGRLWGPVKELIVTRFLRQVSAEEICTVVHVGPERGYTLNCAAYDRFLNDQHPIIKALEGALSRSRILRSEAVLALPSEELGAYVESDLLHDDRLWEEASRSARQALSGSVVDSQLMTVVLKGLIDRRTRA